jgi:glutamate dehydrogenase/leucine dehydrogenase
MDTIEQMIALPPEGLVALLREKGIRRFWFVWHPGSRMVNASHPVLQPLADWLRADKRDFLEHEGLFFRVTREHGVLQGAFIHRTCRGQAAGGVRFWPYATAGDYLRDGLRLAAGMTRKNALAGLWWGGGKGVMARREGLDHRDPGVRRALFREYGELMTSLRGCYVSAEDVGTNVEDMASIHATTRFTTCIPPALGGSGNPSIPTARGVICGMEAALEFLAAGDLTGKTVAVQGMGNVGGPLIGFLLEKGASRIIAHDINAETAARVEKQFGGPRLDLSVVQPGDMSILAADCDLLAPCATGAILNETTIPRIRARVVCGAANNQLEDLERDDQLLQQRGVTYVPDFLTNRMGIVNCADEGSGSIPEDPRIEQHLSRDWEYSIHRMTLKVLEGAKEKERPPAEVATAMADELSLEEHPIFGHRGRKIIDALVASGWHELE